MNSREQNIIQKCKRGDRQAQFDLYQEHKVYLFGICMRYAKSKIEAEDILQEGFYRILKDLGQYQEKGPVRAWMRKVMINSSLMYIRKHKKLVYTELDHGDIEKNQELDFSPYNEDRAQLIIDLVRQLPIAHQSVFNLKAIDGYSFKEIASILNTNEATLRSHFLRARTKLQSLLQKELHYNERK